MAENSERNSALDIHETDAFRVKVLGNWALTRSRTEAKT
jgi:hypothetical protein